MHVSQEPNQLLQPRPAADDPVISYGDFRQAQREFRLELRRLMESGEKRFCDVGGGANPVLPLARIEQFGLRYVVFDDSPDQLQKVAAGYQMMRGSMLDPQAARELAREHGPFDVVFSRWTAEHIRSGRSFHGQIFETLRPGGTAVHLFSTLYAPAFLANRLLPTRASSALLARLVRGRTEDSSHPKFRPYYSWCRGPSDRQLRRLEGLGYTIERYSGFFGHGYYQRLEPLQFAQRALTRALLSHPLPSLTTFALVVLRRPAA